MNYIIHPSFPLKFMTDRHRIQQILINLLSNAIKYTNEGGITVEASLQEETLFISVTDTGIGIESSELTHLFTPYTKIMNGRAMNKDGCGLGLTISQLLANALGGDIKVESELGKGSTFTLVLRYFDEYSMEMQTFV